MKKALPILFALFSISCGTENPSSQNEEKIKDSTTPITEKEAANQVENSDSDIMIPLEATGSYLSYFDDQNSNHPLFKSRYVDSIVRVRMSESTSEAESMVYDVNYLSESEMGLLTSEALIYYCMKYPASFAQICAIYMDTLKFNDSKIFSRIPFRSSDYQFSGKQVKVLEKRRNEIIQTFKDYFNSGPIESYRDYFDILKSINAWEIFPGIIETASEKNLINYTYLLEIMEKNQFAEFLKSNVRKGIYGEDEYYYGGGIESTMENRKEIIRLAKRFYAKKNAK